MLKHVYMLALALALALVLALVLALALAPIILHFDSPSFSLPQGRGKDGMS
jgi:hypothetical protein